MAEETETGTTTTATPPIPPELGYPLNTPLEQMQPEQREAYWKHQSRKHEDRNKALGSITPDELAKLRENAAKAEALELERGTTADKAAAKAAKDAADAARSEFLPDVINARLDAAAARAGVSEDDLAKALQFADTGKLLGADGKVDADKVKAFIDTIKPAVKEQERQQQRGPSSRGQGGPRSASTGSPNVASGRDLWNSRNPTRAVPGT